LDSSSSGFLLLFLFFSLASSLMFRLISPTVFSCFLSPVFLLSLSNGQAISLIYGLSICQRKLGVSSVVIKKSIKPPPQRYLFSLSLFALFRHSPVLSLLSGPLCVLLSLTLSISLSSSDAWCTLWSCLCLFFSYRSNVSLRW
jgi:hypothetical protein